MIRVSYQRADDQWTGVLRAGQTVLVECGHHHTNRDMTTSAGTSAQSCARAILDGARNPNTAADRHHQLRTAWARILNGTGFTLPTVLIEEAKQASAANAAAYLALVDQVRQHPDLTTEAPKPAPAAAEPAEVGEIPDWML